MRIQFIAVLLVCLLALHIVLAHADDAAMRAAKIISGPGTVVYIAAGVAAPLLEDGSDGSQHALRAADSLLTTGIITEGLKKLTREGRPNNPDDKTSFPSGHTSAAFSIAAMEAHFHPHQEAWWYLGAALIGISRVKKRAHHVHDVVAGAALGYGVTRLEISRPHGLLLFPFIKPNSNDHSRATGLAVSRLF